MKGAFISDVDLRNGEGRIDGNEGGGYNEDFFFLHLFFAFVVLAFVPESYFEKM